MIPIHGDWKRNPQRFRAGWRYGRRFRRGALATEEREPGRLERFFDENTEGPGIWKWRHYFHVYERHLARFVDRGPTVVEIGVYSGGSLNMWRDYFGDGVRLVGIDIEPACRVYETDDTQILSGDQADPGFLETVIRATPDGIDVLLDDGGHRAAQQIATLEALLPHLRPGGVYICEDIHGPGHSFHAYIEGLARNLHMMPPNEVPTSFQATIESISRYPFLVVIEKRRATLERLYAPKHGTEWQPFYEPEHRAAKGR